MPGKIGLASAIISGLLIAAHFLRAGLYPLVVIGLTFPFLLFIRKPWATRSVQVLLILATAEWLHTVLVTAFQRCAAGQPWIRMAIILGVVALFTFWSAIAVRQRKRNPYR